MKRPLVLLIAAVFLVSAAACSSDEGSGTVETEGPDEARLTAPAPSEEGSTDPLMVDFAAPTGFVAGEEAPAVTLDREVGETSSLHLDGADPAEAIFVSTYRIEEDTTGWGFDQRAAISDEYVAISGSESEASPIGAVAGGKESVFQYTVFRGADDKYVYQWNTFVFDGYDLIQITCQWRNERELVQAACHEFQAGLTISHG